MPLKVPVTVLVLAVQTSASELRAPLPSSTVIARYKLPLVTERAGISVLGPIEIVLPGPSAYAPKTIMAARIAKNRRISEGIVVGANHLTEGNGGCRSRTSSRRRRHAGTFSRRRWRRNGNGSGCIDLRRVQYNAAIHGIAVDIGVARDGR